MSDFKCSACKTDYDAESNPPRLFPDCGHSVCTECLVSFVDAKLDIACPEDDKPNSLYESDKRLGLDAFPINFSLLPLIVEHRNNNPLETDDYEDLGEDRRSGEHSGDAENLMEDDGQEYPDSSENEQPLDSSGDNQQDTPKGSKEEEMEMFENDKQQIKSIPSDEESDLFEDSPNLHKNEEVCSQNRQEKLRRSKPGLSTIEEEMSKRNLDDSPDRMAQPTEFKTSESNEQMDLRLEKMGSDPFTSPNPFNKQKESKVEEGHMKDDMFQKKESAGVFDITNEKRSFQRLSREGFNRSSNGQIDIQEVSAETAVKKSQNDPLQNTNSDEVVKVTIVKSDQLTLEEKAEKEVKEEQKSVSSKQSKEASKIDKKVELLDEETPVLKSDLVTSVQQTIGVEDVTLKTENNKPDNSRKITESENIPRIEIAPLPEPPKHHFSNDSPSPDAHPVLSKQAEASPPKLETAPKPKTCPLHNKPCDIVCLTDRCLICHKCALFGEHKSHDYKEIDDFRQHIEVKVNEVWLLANTLGIQKMDLNTTPLIESFKAKVQEKRETFLNQLAEKATEIHTAIDKRVSDVIEKINLLFSDFEETYHYIETNSKYLLEKNSELSANLEAGSSKLIQEPMDIQFYLDNYFGELGLAEQTRRHHDQVLEFEANTKSSIDLRLDEIKGDFDVRAALAAIRTTFDISKSTRPVNPQTREASASKNTEKEPKQLHVKINSRDFGRPKSGKDIKKEDSKERSKHGIKEASEVKVVSHTPHPKSKMSAATTAKEALPTPHRKVQKSAEVAEQKEVKNEVKTGTTSTASKNEEISAQKTSKNNAIAKSKDKEKAYIEAPSKSQKKVSSPKGKDKQKPRRHTLQQAPLGIQEIEPINHTRNQPSSNSMLNVLNNLQSANSQSESVDINSEDFAKAQVNSRDSPPTHTIKDEEVKGVSPIIGVQALEFKGTIQPGLTIKKAGSLEPSFEHQQASLIQELQAVIQEEKQPPKSAQKQTNISQNRSINEEDSPGGSFEHSAGERLFKNDDHSHSSLEDQNMEEVHGDEHPDGLFENDRQGAHDDSINQRQAVSFLKKNPMKNADLSGIYSAQSGNSPGNSRIINDVIRNGGRGFQTIGLNKQRQPDYQGYYEEKMTSSAVRQGGLQQNFNSRVGQPSITIQSNYMEPQYGQFNKPGTRTVSDEYEGSGPNGTSKKSFLNLQGGHRGSLYTISQANLQQLQLQSDFREPPSTKNSRGSGIGQNLNFDPMTNSQVSFNQNFASRKPPVSSGQISTGQTAPAKPPMAKNPNREDLDQEMNFSNKAVNINRLPEILSAVIKNPRVKLLNLNNNFINEKGVELICEKLMNHPTLEVISLNGNDIEEEVFEMMLKKFKNNKKAKSIFMRDNKRFKNYPLIRKNVGLLRKLNVKVEIS